MRSATAPSSEHPQPPRRATAARRPGPNGGGGFAGRATRFGRDPELDPETAPPTEPRAVGRPVVGWLDSRSPSECHQVDFRTRPLGASTRQQGHLLGWPGSRQGRAPPARAWPNDSANIRDPSRMDGPGQRSGEGFPAVGRNRATARGLRRPSRANGNPHGRNRPASPARGTTSRPRRGERSAPRGR